MGLMEVMKYFNPIVYPGEPEFPHGARIVKIAAEGSAKVKHRTVLYMVGPKAKTLSLNTRPPLLRGRFGP